MTLCCLVMLTTVLELYEQSFCKLCQSARGLGVYHLYAECCDYAHVYSDEIFDGESQVWSLLNDKILVCSLQFHLGPSN